MKKHWIGSVASMSATVLLSLSGASPARGQDKIRWDMISVQFRAPSAPNIVSAGGADSAVNNDATGKPKLRITITGSGTFSPWDPTDVSGGGDYMIRDMSGNVVDSGSYTVTALVNWVLDSLSPSPPVQVNNITNTSAEDFRNGMAVFRIAYTDGSKGVLVVSCAGPGATDKPFEGISVTKGVVHFQVPDAPVANVDGNRTGFTILHN